MNAALPRVLPEATDARPNARGAILVISFALVFNAANAHATDEPMSMMEMNGFYGEYALNREASGTAWQPEATPMEGLHTMGSEWTTMWHGSAATVDDHQGGSRGGNETVTMGNLMFMGLRRLESGTLGFRFMASIDPLMGKSGYPLLYGSGETADGHTPLIDRQHPHDLIMEAAATFSHPIGNQSSLFTYIGLPGEPALGPPAFMHRFSGEDIPEAPITHHWFDSTHITYGVVTLGAIGPSVKVEASSFNGREPDQYRYNIEIRNFDSRAARISWNPTRELSLQVSQGRLASPEQLQPSISVERRTASAIFQSRIAGAQWGTTLGWGQNRRSDGTSSNAVFLESTLRLDARYTLFARAEHLGNDELVSFGADEAPQTSKVGKISVGGIDDLWQIERARIGVGGLVSRYAHAAALDGAYGHPTSYMLFVRAKLEH